MIDSESSISEDVGKVNKESPLMKQNVQVETRSVEAFLKGGEIWLASTLSPIDYFLSYAHEVGHIIGGKLSFKTGDVLTPDEVKDTYIEMDSRKAAEIVDIITKKQLTPEDSRVLDSILLKYLEIYTKNNYDLNNLRVHSNIDPREMLTMIAGKSLSTGAIKEDGSFNPNSTRGGRNIEIPAYTCQQACQQLLENALQNDYPGLSIDVTWEDRAKAMKDSHYRASAIVNRAYYDTTGMILPSLRDITGREEVVRKDDSITIKDSGRNT